MYFSREYAFPLPMLLTVILLLYFLQWSYRFKRKLLYENCWDLLSVTLRTCTRYQVEFSSNDSRKGIPLQPVFKQMILSLIKKYPGLFGEGYFGGKGLKSWKIYSLSWQNKETSCLIEYLCYTKRILVHGYLIISKYNCPSFWFWLGDGKTDEILGEET